MHRKLIYVFCLGFCFDVYASALHERSAEYYAFESAVRNFKCAAGECDCAHYNLKCRVERIDPKTMDRQTLLQRMGLNEGEVGNLLAQGKQRYDAYLNMIERGLSDLSFKESLQPDGTTTLHVHEPAVGNYEVPSLITSSDDEDDVSVSNESGADEEESYDGLKEYEEAVDRLSDISIDSNDSDEKERYDAPPGPLKSKTRASRLPSLLSLHDDEPKIKDPELQLTKEHTTPPLVPIKKKQTDELQLPPSPASSEDGCGERGYGSLLEYHTAPIGRKGIQGVVAQWSSAKFFKNMRRQRQESRRNGGVDKHEEVSGVQKQMIDARLAKLRNNRIHRLRQLQQAIHPYHE